MSKLNIRKKMMVFLSMGLSLSLVGCKPGKKENKFVGESSLGNFYVKKDLAFTDIQREKVEAECGDGKVVISYCDKGTNDYISGAELAVYDSTGKDLAHYITNDDSFVIDGLTEGNEYIVQELVVPVDYDDKLCSYSFKYTANHSSNINSDEYYKGVNFKIFRDTDFYYLLEEMGNRGSFVVGAYERGNDFLPGVKFEVFNEYGDLVTSWVSTHRSHAVSHLEDGKYDVQVVEVPDGYILNDMSGDCSIEIVDGNCQNEDPVFYFGKSNVKKKKKSN